MIFFLHADKRAINEPSKVNRRRMSFHTTIAFSGFHFVNAAWLQGEGPGMCSQFWLNRGVCLRSFTAPSMLFLLWECILVHAYPRVPYKICSQKCCPKVSLWPKVQIGNKLQGKVRAGMPTSGRSVELDLLSAEEESSETFYCINCDPVGVGILLCLRGCLLSVPAFGLALCASIYFSLFFLYFFSLLTIIFKKVLLYQINTFPLYFMLRVKLRCHLNRGWESPYFTFLYSTYH